MRYDEISFFSFSVSHAIRIKSFGEIRQISRAPNGDLHVDFRRADVADTVCIYFFALLLDLPLTPSVKVCRVRAKVFIAGVGSVQLSWYTGEKR